MGDPMDPNVFVGPMSSECQKQTVVDYINKGISEGARLVTGGPDMPDGLSKGHYVKPTVFADVTNDMVIAHEEIFGPVLAMIKYSTIDEAIDIANDTPWLGRCCLGWRSGQSQSHRKKDQSWAMRNQWRPSQS